MKKKILYRSLIGVSLAGMVSASIYGMYHFSKKQRDKNFIMPTYTKMEKLFSTEQEPIIKERYIAGEKGLSVSKGPIRISSAYNSLLGKKELINLANWLDSEVSWGGSAVSLKNITFTTGIDKSKNGITKGFHTSGRNGSAIFISPDAFEEIGKFGNELFETYRNKAIRSYGDKFSSSIENSFKRNEVVNGISDWLNDSLNDRFNGTSTAVGLGYYKKLKNNEIKDVYSNILFQMWSDDLLQRKLKGTQLSTQAAATKYGDMIFTSSERIAYLIKNNKMNEAVDKHKDKLAFDTALQLFWNATGGSSSLANIYLQLALREIIFKEDFKNEKNQVISYSARPRDEWYKIAGVKKSENITDISLLKNGYFLKTYESGVTSSIILNRIRLYQLFLTFYDQVKDYLNKEKSSIDILKEMWNDPKIIASNSWINVISHLSATDRVRWLLSGEFPIEIYFNIKRSDEWMLTDDEKKFINKQKNILDRKIKIDIDSIFKEIVNTNIFELNNQSISKFYKEKLIESMKYTISHEYGHHETMWANYGIYGQEKKKNVYEDTIGIYSEKRAAASKAFVKESPINLLNEYAKNDKGIRNAISIIMTSGDKYSTTWTPSFISHQYFGFNPTKSGSWTFSEESIFQTRLTSYRDPATGALKRRFSKSENKGTISKSFITQGVDFDGESYKTNYLISFDRSKMSDNNKIKRIDPKIVGRFFRFLTRPDDLFYSYQLTKWILDDGRSGDSKENKEWRIKNKIIIPNISTIGLKKPTTQFVPIITKDPWDKKIKTFTFEGVLRLVFNLSDLESKEFISAIDEVVKKMYNDLIKKYPNLFEEKNGKPKLSDYDRSKVIYKYILNNTKNTLKQVSKENEYDHLSKIPGIYYDPKTLSYIKAAPNESEDELFNKYKNGDLVKDGSVQLSTALNSFADYTGNYAEFMTRVINQLEFRPNYNSFLNNGVLNTEKLMKYNNGWYDDLNRFHALGMDMYKIDFSGKSSELTNTGAKLLNWYRECLGLHIDKTANFNKANNSDLIDFEKLNKIVKSAEPITKIYTNPKTKLTTMWGWLSDANAKKYKKVAFLDSNNKIKYSAPIRTEKTSNYFYYKNMDNKDKYSLNQGYKQWIMDWSIFGNYSNSELPKGKYKMVFLDENGKIYNPDLPKNVKRSSIRFENDYTDNFSRISWKIKDSNEISLEVRN
ncbi:MAG: hypothetical protein HRT99_01465 [Mycoplasmatales bacterium]|nr:hypothetical protein [Mycoplasmatales bacterium]